MIRKATQEDYVRINRYIAKDYARNYFIALGMLKPEVYQAIYIDETEKMNAVLFHRKSGNLQYVSYETYDQREMQALIGTLDFKVMISPKSYCEALTPSVQLEKEGAYISKLVKSDYLYEKIGDVIELMPEDCDLVEALYKKVFPGHPKAAFMKQKLKEGRGIGVKIGDAAIKSVAQSDFGYVIVGVATDPEMQHKGYATRCMHQLIQTLFQSEDALYLQYDNELAGKLYIQLGFKPVDRVGYYSKR